MTDTIGAPVRPAKPGRRPFWLGVLVGAVVALGLVAAVVAFRSPSVTSSVFLLKNRHADGVVETASGLQYKVLTPGKGKKPTDSDVALVNYEGKLLDGTTFDKSPQPTPMPVAGVVPGFAEGLKLMSKGAKYRFWIKPSLAYGTETKGPIPGNSTLAFDVELVDFLPEAVIRQLQMQQQQQMGGAPGTPPAGAAPPTGR